MITYFKSRSKSLPYRVLSAFVAFTFSFSYIVPPSSLYAQGLPATVMNLPVPGTPVPLTPGFTPARIIGMTIHADNPLMFDFMVDPGDMKLNDQQTQDESLKLVKYFLASLTVPAEKLWVNLSPYEKDKIVPEEFGQTEMGAELLAKDYMLKQLTASLMNPEDELGKKFWDRVYEKAQKLFGTTEIPLNTFNKVWIVPEKAVVYANGLNVFILESRFKVMMEEDYLALQYHAAEHPDASSKDAASGISSSIIKEVLLPEIEKEVNEGKTFANLRQIHNSLILAAWYKQNLKESLLGQIYADKAKTGGLTVADKETSRKIYDQYVEAFQKGVHNFIKEDYDPATKQIIPRKYFSGGVTETKLEIEDKTLPDPKVLKAFADTAGDARIITAGVKSPGEEISFKMPFPKTTPSAEPTSSPVMAKFSPEDIKEIESVAGEKFGEILEAAQQVLRLWGDADFLVDFILKSDKFALNNLRKLKELGDSLKEEGLWEIINKDFFERFKQKVRSARFVYQGQIDLAETIFFVKAGETAGYIDDAANLNLIEFILSQLERYSADKEKVQVSEQRSIAKLLARALLETSISLRQYPEDSLSSRWRGFGRMTRLLRDMDSAEGIKTFVQILKKGGREPHVSGRLIEILDAYVPRVPSLTTETPKTGKVSRIDSDFVPEMKKLKEKLFYHGDIAKAVDALRKLEELDLLAENAVEKLAGQNSGFLTRPAVEIDYFTDRGGMFPMLDGPIYEKLSDLKSKNFKGIVEYLKGAFQRSEGKLLSVVDFYSLAQSTVSAIYDDVKEDEFYSKNAMETFFEELSFMIDEEVPASSPVSVSEWIEKTLAGEENIELPAAVVEAEKQKRKYVIGGNLKMKLTPSATGKLIRAMAKRIKEVVEEKRVTWKALENIDIVIAPSYSSLSIARQTMDDVVKEEIIPAGLLQLGAQNVSHEEPGAQTGEESVENLRELGVSYVILGHSERRHGPMQEDSELVNKKAGRTLKGEGGLTPIIAIGETLDEYKSKSTYQVIKDQFSKSTADIDLRRIVIAYEPVWAIGTGKTATPEEANRVQRFVRALAMDQGGDAVGAVLPIEYGGSMNPDNVGAFIAQDNIDGGLIGGAALKADDFIEIVVKSLEHYLSASSPVVATKQDVRTWSGFDDLKPDETIKITAKPSGKDLKKRVSVAEVGHIKQTVPSLSWQRLKQELTNDIYIVELKSSVVSPTDLYIWKF